MDIQTEPVPVAGSVDRCLRALRRATALANLRAAENERLRTRIAELETALAARDTGHRAATDAAATATQTISQFYRTAFGFPV